MLVRVRMLVGEGVGVIGLLWLLLLLLLRLDAQVQLCLSVLRLRLRLGLLRLAHHHGPHWHSLRLHRAVVVPLALLIARCRCGHPAFLLVWRLHLLLLDKLVLLVRVNEMSWLFLGRQAVWRALLVQDLVAGLLLWQAIGRALLLLQNLMVRLLLLQAIWRALRQKLVVARRALWLLLL